jgi:hypothetical protein
MSRSRSPLLAVEEPAVALAFRGRGYASARSRPDQGPGEAKAADVLPAHHCRQPFLLLFPRSIEVDRAHREATVHAEERADRRVNARQLHHNAPNSFWLPLDQRRSSRPSVFKMRDVPRHRNVDVSQAGSLRFDVRLANDRAKVVILFSKKRGKVHAAYLDWIKPLATSFALTPGPCIAALNQWASW